jgi:hypothetical protein
MNPQVLVHAMFWRCDPILREMESEGRETGGETS